MPEHSPRQYEQRLPPEVRRDDLGGADEKARPCMLERSPGAAGRYHDYPIPVELDAALNDLGVDTTTD